MTRDGWRRQRRCVVLAWAAVCLAAGPSPPRTAPADVYTYLEDPERVGEGQEPHHVALRPYADAAAARAGGEATPWAVSLDGRWHLRVVRRPEEVPPAFFAEDHDVSAWDEATVPHTWQTDGLDHPMFRNIPTEMWPDDPPRVPRDVNPTGAYVRTFDLPDHWRDRRSFLRFEGVLSGFFVWVNGAYVGYDQGGLTPAEFDVTPFLRSGRNRVAVQAHRWGSGAHLEVVDQWRFSGIVRSVWMYSTPPTYIRDVAIVTDLDDDYRDATLMARVDIADKGGIAGTHRLAASLHHPDGTPVATLERAVAMTSSGAEVPLSLRVADPIKWTDETPHLYTLVLSLHTGAGAPHVVRQPVGFREIEVRERQLLVNGRRILVKGVNRGDTDPQGGRYVPRERTIADVRLMKRLNVNAVRTSHYPSDPDFYDLADRHGLWIADEIDVETHHHDSCPNDCLAERPEWQKAFLDRFIAMVERDKNHPSVLLWDTGNEAGLGRAHFAIAEWAAAHEPTRPLYHQPNVPDGDAPFAAVWGPRYPSPPKLAAMAERTQKPIVMGEYAHAQGNSLGNFREFWDVVRRHPSVQGGFVWDWAEHNISQPLRTTPDASPNDILAWLTGRPHLVDGHTGHALFFSGLDDFVEVYADRRLDDPGLALTIDAWVCPARPWTGDFTIVAKGRRQYALRMKNAATLELAIGSEGASRTVEVPVPDDWYGAWHRVTGVYDGRTMRLYIDGQERGRTPWSAPIDRSSQPVNVGRNPAMQEMHGGRLAHGAVDAVRVYHRALTPDELAADPKHTAVLALDFDRVDERGRYLSYGVGLGGVDGVVGADRTLQPEAAQLAWVHAPIRIADEDARAGRIRVTNERTFTATADLELSWRVEDAGEVVASGRAPLRLDPGETSTVTLPAPPAGPPHLERWLTVEAVQKSATDWAAAGHVVAFGQFPVGGRQVAGIASPPSSASLAVDDNANEIVVSSADFRYVLDRRQGTLTSMAVRGVELLRTGPELDVWRAPVSNELGVEEGPWRAAGLDRLATTTREAVSRRDGDDVVITFRSDVAAAGVVDASFDQSFVYRITPGGDVRIHHRVDPRGRMRALPYLPRVGFTLRVPAPFDQIRWYGRGPLETYNDRKDGAAMGVWASTVDAEYVDYHRPQDYGNHEDVRWVSLSDGQSAGVLVAGDIQASVTAWDDLDRAAYPFARIRNDGWNTLHVGHLTSGVSETFHAVMPSYRADADREYAYSVLLRPLSTSEVKAGGRPGGPATCAPEMTLVPDREYVEAGTSARATLTASNPCRETLPAGTVVVRAPLGWTSEREVIPAAPLAPGASHTIDIDLTRTVGSPAGRRVAVAEWDSASPAGERLHASATAHWTAVPAPPRGDVALSALPFLRADNEVGPVERDRSNGRRAAGDGGPLTIGGRTYASGLGVHSESSVEIYLGGRCSSFHADVGIDDAVGSGGSVGFAVYADGARRFASPRLTGADGPLPIEVDVRGAQVLRLRVHDAADRGFGDSADWADARLRCD